MIYDVVNGTTCFCKFLVILNSQHMISFLDLSLLVWRTYVWCFEAAFCCWIKEVILTFWSAWVPLLSVLKFLWLLWRHSKQLYLLGSYKQIFLCHLASKTGQSSLIFSLWTSICYLYHCIIIAKGLIFELFFCASLHLFLCGPFWYQSLSAHQFLLWDMGCSVPVFQNGVMMSLVIRCTVPHHPAATAQNLAPT